MLVTKTNLSTASNTRFPAEYIESARGISIGDTVIIKSPGLIHSTYSDMATFMEATKFEAGFNNIYKGTMGTVVAMAVHPNKVIPLALVNIGEREVIMDVSAIERVDKHHERKTHIKKPTNIDLLKAYNTYKNKSSLILGVRNAGNLCKLIPGDPVIVHPALSTIYYPVMCGHNPGMDKNMETFRGVPTRISSTIYSQHIYRIEADKGAYAYNREWLICQKDIQQARKEKVCKSMEHIPLLSVKHEGRFIITRLTQKAQKFIADWVNNPARVRNASDSRTYLSQKMQKQCTKGAAKDAPCILLSTSVYNILQYTLTSFLSRHGIITYESSMHNSYPCVYIAGTNSKGIVSALYPVHRADEKKFLGCGQLPEISIEEMSKAIALLAKHKYTPAGIIRVGSFFARSDDDRGKELEVIKHYAIALKGFVLSVGRGVRIEGVKKHENIKLVIPFKYKTVARKSKELVKHR